MYVLRPKPSSHSLPPNRLIRVNEVASIIVRSMGQRYHVKPEDRIGRHIHINLVHGMLGMLDELDHQSGRYGR
jgi:hypothetical protein